MSWSFTAVGKPKAVMDKASKEMLSSTLMEPEKTIRQAVFDILITSLSSMPDDSAVKIETNGSQWKRDDGTALNNLSVKIETLYGFVE